MFAVPVAPPNQRLHLSQAPFVVFALDCLFVVVFCGPAAPVIRRGRSRAAETLIR
jgi:hypothetical protein